LLFFLLQDDWDASDDEEALAKKAADAKPAGPAPPVRAKGITKQKIAEREAADKARLAEQAARNDDDPVARKQREKAAILRADMDSAALLFGSSSISEDPLSARLLTTDDFNTFTTTVSDMIVSRHGDSPLYAVFVENFVKALCTPLNDVEVRKTASGLTTLANEKQKAQKDAQGGKKKSKGAAKPALGAAKAMSRAADTSRYEEALDDEYDDDFM
jgi:translation initiation factor 3 subunit J